MNIKELFDNMTKNIQNNAGYRTHSPIVLREAVKEELAQKYGKQQIEQMIREGQLLFVSEPREE